MKFFLVIFIVILLIFNVLICFILIRWFVIFNIFELVLILIIECCGNIYVFIVFKYIFVVGWLFVLKVIFGLSLM